MTSIIGNSSISLGTATTNSNGQTVLSGLGSQLNDQQLITALVQAQQLQLKPIQDQVTLNNNKLTALQQFNTLVTTLKNDAQQLSNPPGFNNASNNAFAQVNATVTSNTSTAGSTYLSVTAAAGTTPQTYTLGALGGGANNAIIQLAQAGQQTSNAFTVATADTAFVVAGPPAAGQIGAGTFNVNGIAITLNTGDSLNTVAADFNAISGQTGISATVLQPSTGSFKLVFSATQTGAAHAFNLNEGGPGSVITNDTSLAWSQVVLTNTQTAQDSKFVLDGQTVQRSTNSISDAISGLTFNLLQATPDNTTLNLAITPNTTAAQNGVVNFMNAYNDLMTFYANQTQLNSDGTLASTSYLANDSTVSSTINSIQSQLANAVSGLSGTYTSLASLGISFTNLPAQTDSTGKQTQPAVNNVLTFDQTTLQSALASNFSKVQAVFGFTFTSNNANLAVNTRTNNLAVNNFTLNLNPGTSTFQATYTDGTGSHTVNLTATPFISGGGYTLTGQTGTALSGLSMLYGSTSAATISVTATQGVGDWVYNLANSLTTTNTGGIALDQSSINSSTTALNNNLAQLNTQIAAYQQQLQTKFTALETALAKANSILAVLNAQQTAQLSSSVTG